MATANGQKYLHTEEIVELLRVRFSPPAFGFLTQVANGTGGRHYRWADALVMSVWPSRGIYLTGCEIKASRYDWQKELRNPEKAEAICQYCTHWYVVAGHSGIVEPGELPKTWGLLVCKGAKLMTEVEAPRLKPKPPNLDLLAAIFRRAAEQTVDERLINKARAAGEVQGKEAAQSEFKYEQERHARLEKVVADFEEASGIRMSGYANGKELGEIVYKIRHGEHVSPRSEIERLRERVAETLEALDKSLAECDAAERMQIV